MKIAFMVMAHTDAAQLNNLVKRLSPNDFFDSHIFIHIDKKANISDFVSVTKYKYVTVISKRIDVTRCGISQVDASLELMKAALESGTEFDRYILITGQDYPIVSNEQIFNTLSQKEIEFMRGYKVTGTSMNKKVRKYYFYNKHLTGSPFWDLIRRLLQFIVSPISKKDTVEIDNNQWEIYYSSAYFAVSHSLFIELYSKGKNKKYYDYFKTAICSDEMYFITIAANSRFRDKLEAIDTDSHTLLDNSSITYFKYLNRPIELTENNYLELVDCGRMFARKFSSSYSTKLIELLEKEGRGAK